MSVVEVFRRAGLEVSEEELARLAAEALAEVMPRYSAAQADTRTRRVLSEAGLDMSAEKPGELEQLVAAETLAYTSLLASSLTVSEAAARIGVDPSRVRQRLANGSLYGVRVGRAWRLPEWQFDGSAPLRGLDRLLGALGGELDPVSVARFATQPNEELLIGGEPVAPVQWLAAGRPIEAVAEIARYLEAA